MSKKGKSDADRLEDQADDLPDLTPQQMTFVRQILAGKSNADAYRAAYNCQRSTPEAIWVSASRLRRHPKIALWIDAAREICLGSAVMTLADHLRELERLKTLAIKGGNFGAAVQCEQLRGKASGYYVDRVEDITATHDPMTILDQIGETNPEVAEALAREKGIAWTRKTASKH